MTDKYGEGDSRKCLPISREWLEGLWDKQCPGGRPTKQAAGSRTPSSIQHLAAWSTRSSAPLHCLFRRAWSLLGLSPRRSLPKKVSPSSLGQPRSGSLGEAKSLKPFEL